MATRQSSGVLAYIRITRCIARCAVEPPAAALERPLWGFFSVRAHLSPTIPHEAWQGELHTANTPQPHSELHYHSSVRRGVERARARVRAAELELQRAKVELYLSS